MIILNAEDVRKALPMREAMEAMKGAYASLSEGTAVAPIRTRLPILNSDALSLFMPAYVHSREGKRWRSMLSRYFQPTPRADSPTFKSQCLSSTRKQDKPWHCWKAVHLPPYAPVRQAALNIARKMNIGTEVEY